MYFVKGFHPLRIQNNQFGMANYLGLVAAVLFLMLLVISNDISLRGFGTTRWKSLQRWAYIAGGLSVIHGVLFQLIEKRHLSWVVVFYSVVVVVLCFQMFGLLRFASNKRHSINERNRVPTP